MREGREREAVFVVVEKNEEMIFLSLCRFFASTPTTSSATTSATLRAASADTF
jgi:hypothetical protein